MRTNNKPKLAKNKQWEIPRLCHVAMRWQRKFQENTLCLIFSTVNFYGVTNFIYFTQVRYTICIDLILIMLKFCKLLIYFLINGPSFYFQLLLIPFDRFLDSFNGS